MLDLDITEQNVAVEQLLDQTTNPRHRYLPPLPPFDDSLLPGLVAFTA